MSDRIERRIFGRSVCGKARQPCHPIQLGGDSAIVNQLDRKLAIWRACRISINAFPPLALESHRASQACRLPGLQMPFDIEHAETLRTASRRAAITLRAAQGAVLDGIRSQAPIAFMQLLDRSRREASAASSAAAAAYSLYLRQL